QCRRALRTPRARIDRSAAAAAHRARWHWSWMQTFYRGLENLLGPNPVQTPEVARLAQALIAGGGGEAVNRERDRRRSRRSPRCPRLRQRRTVQRHDRD